MIGLVYMLTFALYLAISYFVVRAVVRWAKRTGRSPKKWGWGAGIAMYLLIFWDVVPTLVVHHVLCNTVAEARVYKTADQWLAEHAGEQPPKRVLPSNLGSQDAAGRPVTLLNDRFAIRHIWTRVWPLTTMIDHRQIVDVPKDYVVLESTSVSSGYGSLGNSSDWRAMLPSPQLGPCEKPTAAYIAEYQQYLKLVDK